MDAVKQEIKLKVMEALQEEAYRGIVRIDSQTMRDIGVRPGDIVEVEGTRKTVGVVDRAYPTDVGQTIIRMDGIMRRNAKTSLGEFVRVRRAEVKEARSVTIAPAQKGVTIQADPIYFKRGLIGRALIKGDQVALGGGRRRRKTIEGGPFEDIFDIFEPDFGIFGFTGLKFIVIITEPKQAVLVTENTEVVLNPKAVEILEEKVVEVTYEDIGGLTDEVKKIREMVELPLKHPELFQRLGIEPPKGVLLHGPPGTGKTLLAKAVANETNAHFIHLDGPSVMCVSGDTEILTYENNFVRAEELFNKSKVDGIIENSNNLEMIKLKNPINVHSIDNELKSVMGKITHVTKLKADSYSIKTSDNKDLIVSHNQPFAVLNNKLEWKTLKELKIGDEILKLNEIENRNSNQVLSAVTTCKIEEIIPLGKRILYDFTINPYENFIATKNLLILHNSKYVGEAEKRIRDIFEEAEKNSPSIIFIDEIDAIASKREESYGEVERRVVAQILATMDGLKSRGRVVVIAATNRPNSIDPALRRPGRFDREIEIGVPKEEARLQILKIHTRNMPLTNDVNLDELARVTHGFVGADLEVLCKEAAIVVLRKLLPELKYKKDEPIPTEFLEKLIITISDFKEALKSVRPSALREVFIERPTTKWGDIGGLENIKQDLKEAVEWPLKCPEVFKSMGIKAPKGVLLYGPPGTGKTLLARAIANESEANFILVNGPELLSKWVGDSEKGIRKVFEKARQASPTIIFFDEVDAIAPRRGRSSDAGVTERMVNQMLTEIDGLQELNDVIVIGATNRPDILDPALLRPGRFDRLVLAPVPDDKARLQILKIHTKGMPLTKDVDLEVIAEKTQNFVGADIEALCREAAILALRKDMNAKQVNMKNFNEALKRVKPSITSEDIKRYEEIEDDYLRTARGAAIRDKDALSYMG
ncbi:MAG TPA: AAA family ATPase [Candidatus Nanoarchaeia archaeon]|nr:AAA family ATPase [Candidatus Nanoarchaeia archaeon]